MLAFEPDLVIVGYSLNVPEIEGLPAAAHALPQGRLVAALALPVELGASKRLLEVACGEGGFATHIAERFGPAVVGVDIHESAIGAARARARSRRLEPLVTFERVDADRPLLFDDASFDAVLCNDAINHLRDRRCVLSDWHRLLKPGGYCLFTDPIVVTG